MFEGWKDGCLKGERWVFEGWRDGCLKGGRMGV